jgi:uncharacterized protein with HEPN domain
MSKRNSKLLIEDILEASEKIRLYLNGYSFETFSDDSKTIDAVIRNFEIIGEAANRIPSEFKEDHENIEWYRIIGFRNRIVHDYMGVDLSIVWNIYESFLPKLTSDLKVILKSL